MSDGSQSATADRYHDVIHFDRWAPRYDESFLQTLLFGPTHEAVIAAAREARAQPATVLDLRCGTGRLLGCAAEAWPAATLVGIDAASEMVQQAPATRDGDARFRFEIADVAALPLADGSVDIAFSTISFHHWADQRGGLREIARMLRPYALFVLADLRPPLLLWPVLRGSTRALRAVAFLRSADSTLSTSGGHGGSAEMC